jgi:hypothetical protein
MSVNTLILGKPIIGILTTAIVGIFSRDLSESIIQDELILQFPGFPMF